MAIFPAAVEDTVDPYLVIQDLVENEVLTFDTSSSLIGRRALVALGLPVLTVDYDFCGHIDDLGLQ